MITILMVLMAVTTKADLVTLAKAGCSDELIVAFIVKNGPVGALSSTDVADLKKAGVSDRVLAKALEAPRTAGPTIVYLPSAPAAPITEFNGASYTPPVVTYRESDEGVPEHLAGYFQDDGPVGAKSMKQLLPILGMVATGFVAGKALGGLGNIFKHKIPSFSTRGLSHPHWAGWRHFTQNLTRKVR